MPGACFLPEILKQLNYGGHKLWISLIRRCERHGSVFCTSRSAASAAKKFKSLNTSERPWVGEKQADSGVKLVQSQTADRGPLGEERLSSVLWLMGRTRQYRRRLWVRTEIEHRIRWLQRDRERWRRVPSPQDLLRDYRGSRDFVTKRPFRLHSVKRLIRDELRMPDCLTNESNAS